jgi:hypothetical protein
MFVSQFGSISKQYDILVCLKNRQIKLDNFESYNGEWYNEKIEDNLKLQSGEEIIVWKGDKDKEIDKSDDVDLR